MLPTTEDGALLSSQVIPAKFLTPMRAVDYVDYEWGGVRIRDTSQGLMSHLWTGIYEGSTLSLSNGVVRHNINIGLNVRSMSFCFDQNMNPAVVYVRNGVGYLYWYDPVAAAQVTLQLDYVVEYPQITLDDHRASQVGASDIILSYIRDDKLYCRIQRERYLQEHFLEDVPNRRLKQVGMTANYRLRWRHVQKELGE